MDFKLSETSSGPAAEGPLVLVILDGVGLYRGRSEGYEANAFDLAETPVLDRLLAEAAVSTQLRAHGTAVGLPSDDDMGNSEVGHNAMGAGRVFEQGAKLVSAAITSRRLFSSPTWRWLVEGASRPGETFHLIGLLSDGNVHSHIDHLMAMLVQLADDGVGRIRVHALADGRDVAPRTFHLFVEQLENVLGALQERGIDAKIASGGGRMKITMDRYGADWDMVRRGWQTHVHGQGRGFVSAATAVQELRGETAGIIDQDLPAFVITDAGGAPVGSVEDGDSVVFFNFRGDRATEICRAFTDEDFSHFDRGKRPSVRFAGMMEYDGDLHIPPNYLVDPPAISETVSQYLIANGISQLAVAETQKFGHVTYFWNGNNSEKFDDELEDWIEVTSDNVPFETAPEMKAREVTEVVLESLRQRQHRFVRVNIANGDMVGHTGILEAAVQAMEVVDECVGRIYEATLAAGGTIIVTADHGNLDMMWDVDKKTGEIKRDEHGDPVMKTSHTLNPVPWAVLGHGAESFELNPSCADLGLGNLAATLLLLLGLTPPESYLPPIIRHR